MEQDDKLLTRASLAVRWGISPRTLDRKRKLGLIPWIDLAGGLGNRPIVRFRLIDILSYEQRMLQAKKSREPVDEPWATDPR